MYVRDVHYTLYTKLYAVTLFGLLNLQKGTYVADRNGELPGVAWGRKKKHTVFLLLNNKI